MRAWRVHRLGEPAEVLSLDEVPEPSPRAGQVVIDVEASALGFPDVLLCRGRYQRRPSLPFIPGGEVAGRVSAIGEGTDLRVGQRVAALPHAGLAERVVAAEVGVFDLEGLGLGWAEAAAFPSAYQTGYAALHLRAGLRAGETVLVHAGAGAVGSATIQLAVVAGARVLATAGSDEKLSRCTEAGADLVVNNRRDDVIEAVREATCGRGVDVVVDPVGGSLFDDSLGCLAFDGRLVAVGFSSGQHPDCAVNRVLIKNASVVGLHWGLYATHRPELVSEVHWKLAELVDQGRIRPLIFGEYGMDEVPALLEKVAAGQTWGRVVVRPKGVPA
jgi:NADPH2:quinone reductase